MPAGTYTFYHSPVLHYDQLQAAKFGTLGPQDLALSLASLPCPTSTKFRGLT